MRGECECCQGFSAFSGAATRTGVLLRDAMRIPASARSGRVTIRAAGLLAGRRTGSCHGRCHLPAAAPRYGSANPRQTQGIDPSPAGSAAAGTRLAFASAVARVDGPGSGRCGRSWRAWRWRCSRGRAEGSSRAPPPRRSRGLALVSVQPATGPASLVAGALRRLCLVHDGLQRRAVGRLALDPGRRQPVARRLVGKPPLPLLAARLAGGRLHPRRRTAGHGGLPPGRDRVRAALHDRPHRRPRPLRRHARVPGVVEREPQLRGVSAAPASLSVGQGEGHVRVARSASPSSRRRPRSRRTAGRPSRTSPASRSRRRAASSPRAASRSSCRTRGSARPSSRRRRRARPR